MFFICFFNCRNKINLQFYVILSKSICNNAWENKIGNYKFWNVTNWNITATRQVHLPRIFLLGVYLPITYQLLFTSIIGIWM